MTISVVTSSMSKGDCMTITRRFGRITGIDITIDQKLRVMFDRLEIWTERKAYFTSTRKVTVKTVRHMVNDVGKQGDNKRHSQEVRRTQGLSLLRLAP